VKILGFSFICWRTFVETIDMIDGTISHYPIPEKLGQVAIGKNTTTLARRIRFGLLCSLKIVGWKMYSALD